MAEHVIIVGGFNNEEMLPTLVEGFQDAGCTVTRFPSRGVIEQYRERDLRFADKEIMRFPKLGAMQYQTEDGFANAIREAVKRWDPALLVWWYGKDDRPEGLVESLDCPTVRFSWDDPMSLEGYGEDWSKGFTHAVTGCRGSLPHYEERGIKAMYTLPPISRTRHGLAKPNQFERCDLAFTFYALYDGEAPYLREQVKRRDLVETAATLPVTMHVYGGWGRREFKRVPRTAYRGFRTNYELPGVFASCAIAVTQHPQIDADGYVSPRDMEAMASGAFLLSDCDSGVIEHFGGMVGFYESLDDFREQVLRWLTPGSGALDMAIEARKHVKSEYSGKRFAERLLEFVG